MYYELLPDSVKSAKKIILLDGGYFVFRMTKHWSPKGKMRQAHNRLKRGKINWFQRQAAFKKAINNDVAYVGFRLGEMKLNPKYESDCRVIVCWDGIHGRRNRGNLDSQYKANRHGAEETYSAAEHEGVDIREKLSSIGLEPNNLSKGWHGLYDAGLEGDDLMAHLAFEAIEKEKEVIILSSDSDMVQMLAQPLRLHDFTKEITAIDVYEKYGVLPRQYADWKALVGDVSDNIVGVPFIGPIAAKKLISEWDNLDSIPAESITTIKPKYDISRRLNGLRKKEGYSLSYAKKKFGSAWERMEKGDVNEFSWSAAHKILNLIGDEHFETISYRERLNCSRKLIEIPFK